MTDTPEDWVLIEAAKRCGWDARPERLPMLQADYGKSLPYRALCDMIAKHEQKPVDRKLLCAREAARQYLAMDVGVKVEWSGLRAIHLYEEGFGK